MAARCRAQDLVHKSSGTTVLRPCNLHPNLNSIAGFRVFRVRAPDNRLGLACPLWSPGHVHACRRLARIGGVILRSLVQSLRLDYIWLGFCMDTTRLFKGCIGLIVQAASQPAEGRSLRSAEEITL